MKTPFKPSIFVLALLAAATFCCATPENSQPNLAPGESPLAAAEPESQASLPFSWTFDNTENSLSDKQVVRVLMAPG